MKFLVLNGPNLNLLGKREPGVYGTGTYAGLCAEIAAYAAARGILADIRQSNHEGVLIDEIQAADGVYDGIVINPGPIPITATPFTMPCWQSVFRRWRCTSATSAAVRRSAGRPSPPRPAGARSWVTASGATWRPWSYWKTYTRRI